jgi:cellulose 1,4-beta-cellobiosidase
MDIWEANSISAAFTPHPCSVSGATVCDYTSSADNCGVTSRYDSLCDPDGCDFNSYRMGNTSFYGPGDIVDTSSKFTIVTQFLTDDNTTTGTLSEIRRLYVQNGVVIQNSAVNIAGMDPVNSITTDYCTQQKEVFNNTDSFSANGGLANMGAAFSTGVVLVLSLWDDYAVDMLWLDSDYPTTADASAPGVARGTCATTSGVPATVESSDASASVVYSNIKFGDIGSTYTSGTTTSPGNPGSPGTTTTHSSTTTATAPGATQTKYGQWYVFSII